MVVILKMNHIWLMAFVLIGLCLYQSVDGRAREDVVYTTSFLDSNYVRTVFRSFRNMVFSMVGKTGDRTKGPFLQEEEDKFPCDLRNMRSAEIPTSVHRLRPGKNNKKMMKRKTMKKIKSNEQITITMNK
jgi:hypothetical protein